MSLVVATKTTTTKARASSPAVVLQKKLGTKAGIVYNKWKKKWDGWWLGLVYYYFLL